MGITRSRNLADWLLSYNELLSRRWKFQEGWGFGFLLKM